MHNNNFRIRCFRNLLFSARITKAAKLVLVRGKKKVLAVLQYVLYCTCTIAVIAIFN